MHRRKDGEEYWVFPGGKSEEGETARDTLKREIWEETSLRVTHVTKEITACFFECVVEDGQPKLDPSGTEKITDTDWYNPEWINLTDAKKLEKLYPESLAIKFLQLYENK